MLNQDLIDQTEDLQAAQPGPPGRVQGRQLQSSRNDNSNLSRNSRLAGKGFPSASSNFRHHPEKNSMPRKGNTNTMRPKGWGGCRIQTIELRAGIDALKLLEEGTPSIQDGFRVFQKPTVAIVVDD